MESNDNTNETVNDLVTENSNETEKSISALKNNSLQVVNIILFNVFLLLTIIIGIILTFTKREPVSTKEMAGIPFRQKGYAVRVIHIYNLIEYQKMVPYVSKRLQQAQKAKNIKAVILKINSGGGTVGASQEIYRQILLFKEKTKNSKPVIAVLGDIAASGGYYIACAADEIIASRGTLTGSIGVIMTGFTFKKLFDDIGIKQDIIKSGQFKDLGTALGRDKTPEEIVLLQKIVDETYQQFFNVVLTNRKNRKELNAEKLKQHADGRIMNGETALNIGLIDQLGGMEEALNLIKKNLSLKKLFLIEDEKSPFSQIIDLLNSKQSISLEAFLKNHSYGMPLYLYIGGK